MAIFTENNARQHLETASDANIAAALQWCLANPGWVPASEISDLSTIYHQFKNVPFASDDRTMRHSDEVARIADEIGDPCLLPYGFISRDHEFYALFEQVPSGTKTVQVFKIDDPIIKIFQNVEKFTKYDLAKTLSATQVDPAQLIIIIADLCNILSQLAANSLSNNFVTIKAILDGLIIDRGSETEKNSAEIAMQDLMSTLTGAYLTGDERMAQAIIANPTKRFFARKPNP